MIKSIGKLTLAAILAATVLGVPVKVLAQDKTTNAAPAAPTKPKATRFSGKLGKVDSVAKTITVENKTKERVFVITSETKITKDSKPATLSDGVVGESVTGSFSETDGKMVAKTVHFGAKPKTTTAEAPAAK
jgi:hypothetical protein